MNGGSLTVVGTGIQFGSQLTAEARIALESADLVLFLAAGPEMKTFVESLNANAHSLHGFYEVGERRAAAYEAMAEEILRRVREGLEVCVAFYGHPGVFVTPSHDAVRRAREEGFPARMLPGVSAEDCLFADLGVDPSRRGCQSYEATEFLVHARRIDPTAALVVWQIGTVGRDTAATGAQASGLPVLVERLLEDYPGSHEVTVYEAAPYPAFEPLVRTVPLSELAAEHVTALSTLYVPALEPPVVDLTMFDRLDLPRPE